MAAAITEISVGTATLANDGDGYSNVPVTWATTEDAIEDALHDDPDLLTEISSKLDTDLVLTPDRDLNIEDDEESNGSETAGGFKDSDTASNSSSLRDADDSLSNGAGDDISPRKGPTKTVITINKTSAISSQIEQVKEEAKSSKSSSSKTSDTPRTNSSSPSPSSSSTRSKDKEYSNGKNGEVGPKNKSIKSLKEASAEDKRRGSVVSKTSDTGSASSNPKTSSSKNPLKLLKRLSKFDKNSKKKEHYK